VKRLESHWTPLCQLSFEKLKHVLTCTPILQHPIDNIPYQVATDASNTGIGVVLFQLVNKKVYHIGFFAQSLLKSERNYSTTKRELLAIVFALNKFHKYLWGNHFTLFTDHKALTYIHTQKIANPMMITWLDTILQYSFTVIHIPGMTNVLPDALSRLFPLEKELAGDENKHRRINYKEQKMNQLMDKQRQRMAHLSNENEEEATEENYLVPEDDKRNQIIRLYHRTAAVYSESHLKQPEEQQRESVEDAAERQELLARQHAFGHFGAEVMEKAIHADGMHWPNLRQDAIDMVKKCNQCMKYNVVRKGYNPLGPVTAKLPGDHWAIDLAGPFEQTHRGNIYILVMVDICTKVVIIKAIQDKTSPTIACGDYDKKV
jgi:hypothetical protein